MTDIKEIPDILEPWSKGQVIEAAHLQQVVDVVNKALIGANPPTQIIRPTKGIIMKQFKIKKEEDDHLECVFFNGEDEGENEINIAKPFALRKTPFADKTVFGYTYTYDLNPRTDERLATGKDDFVGFQYLFPLYNIDTVIWAIHGIVGGFDGAEELEDVDGKPIIWVDANLDGRNWQWELGPPPPPIIITDTG